MIRMYLPWHPHKKGTMLQKECNGFTARQSLLSTWDGQDITRQTTNDNRRIIHLHPRLRMFNFRQRYNVDCH